MCELSLVVIIDIIICIQESIILCESPLEEINSRYCLVLISFFLFFLFFFFKEKKMKENIPYFLVNYPKNTVQNYFKLHQQHFFKRPKLSLGFRLITIYFLRFPFFLITHQSFISNKLAFGKITRLHKKIYKLIHQSCNFFIRKS